MKFLGQIDSLTLARNKNDSFMVQSIDQYHFKPCFKVAMSIIDSKGPKAHQSWCVDSILDDM